MQEEYDRFVASHDTTEQRDLCDTRCFGIRREVFERFPFDTEEPYCEDAALGRRLFEARIPILFVREWRVGHHYTRSAFRELSRLRRYAAASAAHLRRTGRDLFRAPGAEAPRGPGASLLRSCLRQPALARSVAAVLWLSALALGAGARAPSPLGRRLFSAARRAAVLSARIAGQDGAGVRSDFP
jgi:GT2 family glycosyltransferase